MDTYKIELEAYSEEQLLKQVKAEYKRLKRRRQLGVKLSRKLYRLLRENAFAMWLGISSSVMGYHFYSWQFWFLLLPTILLVQWSSKSS